MPITFFWIFLGAMAIGVPIVFAFALAPFIGFLLVDKADFLRVFPQRIFLGINQFPLLAIPLFLLAGEIMNVGGITHRIVAFANALVGHLRGGLGHVNIVAGTFFAGLSGSAVADLSGLGSILIPAMERDGYSKRYATAVTASAALLGPIIPPSIIMVIYAYIMQVSVGALFAAGFVPGVIIGLGLMAVHYVISVRRGYPKRERATLGEAAGAFRGALLPLLTPVIILGGILSGVFTPTEAAGAAVAYALLLSAVVLRTLSHRELPGMLYRTGVSAAAILLVIGTATIFSWVASLSGFPNVVAQALFSVSDNPLVLLFLINILLFITGMFFDAGPAILILGPILAPTVLQLGIHPVHFAIVMCVNLTFGLATPPVGLVLFVASAMTRLSVEVIAKEMLPFYVIYVAVIFIITYFPAVALTVPGLLGLL